MLRAFQYEKSGVEMSPSKNGHAVTGEAGGRADGGTGTESGFSTRGGSTPGNTRRLFFLTQTRQCQ